MSTLGTLSTINNLAYLSGIFDWQMTDGSYTNPNGQTTSFHIINNQQAPIEQYVQGAISAYNLIAGPSLIDPNQGLFNTNLIANGLHERIVRKYTLNRVPYANYDQPVDLGVGSQKITFNVVLAGTMYLTALTNLVQSLFINDISGLGILSHPFYGEINNVLPIEFGISYNFESLNCAICELVFLTSDITHLSASSISSSILSTIGKYYTGVSNSITSIGGTISAVNAIGSNTLATL